MPDAHITEVTLLPISDVEESSDDLRMELDSSANMVILRSNSFFFESTGRACDARPLSSDLFIEKNVPIVDTALACDCPCTGEFFLIFIINVL